MTLAEIIAARLTHMSAVARYKWNHGLAVSDPKREAVIVERTVAIARTKHLDEDYATHVVAAQMYAAKLIQTALFERWRAAGQGEFGHVGDLDTELRPAIGKLTGDLLEALAALQPSLARCQLPVALRSTPSSLRGFAAAWRVAVLGLLPARCAGQAAS